MSTPVTRASHIVVANLSPLICDEGMVHGILFVSGETPCSDTLAFWTVAESVFDQSEL